MPADFSSSGPGQEVARLPELLQKKDEVNRPPNLKLFSVKPRANVKQNFQAAFSALRGKNSYDVDVRCFPAKASPTSSFLSSPGDLSSLDADSTDYELDDTGSSMAASAILYLGEDDAAVSLKAPISTLSSREAHDENLLSPLGMPLLLSQVSDVSQYYGDDEGAASAQPSRSAAVDKDLDAKASPAKGTLSRYSQSSDDYGCWNEWGLADSPTFARSTTMGEVLAVNGGLATGGVSRTSQCSEASMSYDEWGDADYSPRAQLSPVSASEVSDDTAVAGQSLIPQRSDVSSASLMSNETPVKDVSRPSNASTSLEEASVKGALDSLAGEGTGLHGASGKVRFEDLVFKQIVGKGVYAQVRLVQDKRTDEVYALKVIPKERIAGTDVEKQVVRECEAMMSVESPFCIRLVHAYQNRDALFFLMEWVPGGELKGHLNLELSFKNSTARFYVASVLLALEHVHSLGYVYRDIKPENLLLDNRGYLKMVDFGLAKRILTGRTYTVCGTREYQAPEVIKATGTGREADYWAVGVLICELLVGVTPFVSESFDALEVAQRIERCEYKIHPKMPRQAADLMERLLVVEPKDRLGAGAGGVRDIMAHPWFADFDWEALKTGTMKAPIVPLLCGAADGSQYNVIRDTGIPAYNSEIGNPAWDTMWDWTDAPLPRAPPRVFIP